MTITVSTTPPPSTQKRSEAPKLPEELHGPIHFRLYRTLTNVFQVFSDFLTIALTFIFAFWIYTGVLENWSPQPFEDFFWISILAGFVYVLVAERVGLYRFENSLLNIKELRACFRTGLFAAAILLSASFYIRSMSFSRITLTIAIIIAPLFLYLQRLVAYQLGAQLHRRGLWREKVVVYGAGNIGRNIAARMFESPRMGLLPVGFLDDNQSKIGTQIPLDFFGRRYPIKVMGGKDQLEQLKTAGVTKVFIALPSAKFEKNLEIVSECNRLGLEYSIVPNTYENFLQVTELFEIGGIPLFRKKEYRVSFYYLIAKRIIDFTLSAVFLIFLSPVMLLISLLIKLNSPGPIIFKQKRVGYRGREFSFYKFRTMFVEAPQYAVTPSDSDDPRITSIGRWLRRTSLDELPQLFNVLRGDMSLVGPRPEMPFVVERYDSLMRRRLEAKPGITGVWQISSARAAPIHENLEFDLFYLENRSILLDFAVIIKTVLSVIRGVGAF